MKGDRNDKEKSIDVARQCLPSPDDGSNGLCCTGTNPNTDSDTYSNANADADADPNASTRSKGIQVEIACL